MPYFIPNSSQLSGKSCPLKIYYELEGKGPHKVVFIGGLNSTIESWEIQRNSLSKHEKFQLCFFDNRGIGRSTNPNLLISTSQMAQDTKDLLDHLGWKKDVHLVGISMGGMIALELISTHPAYFSSASLINTHAGRTFTPAYGVWQLFMSILQTNVEKKVDKHISPLLYGSKLAQQDWAQFRQYHLRIIAERPVVPFQTFAKQCVAILTHHVSAQRLAELQDSRIRLLVFVSTEDQLVYPHNSFYIAEKTGARLEVFPGCGHALNIQESEKFHEILENHILQDS